MNAYKYSIAPVLIALSLLLISCGESTGQQTKTAQPGQARAKADSPKALLHKWRMDMPLMKRQMGGYRNAVVNVAKEVDPGSEAAVRQAMNARLAGWLEEMKDDYQEFLADGTRLSMEGGKTRKGRYRISPARDSLYFLTADGRMVEEFGIVSLADTALIVTRNIGIPMTDPKDRRFYQATVKFVHH